MKPAREDCQSEPWRCYGHCSGKVPRASCPCLSMARMAVAQAVEASYRRKEWQSAAADPHSIASFRGWRGLSLFRVCVSAGISLLSQDSREHSLVPCPSANRQETPRAVNRVVPDVSLYQE
jgi:hypothetical protein